jgi:hypothetical protein
MIQLLKTKQDEVVVTKEAVTKTVTVQSNKAGSYVNLQCIVNDHSPLVIEYLDNEIANLKRKISTLEKERTLVSQLYQVIQNQANSTETF